MVKPAFPYAIVTDQRLDHQHENAVLWRPMPSIAGVLFETGYMEACSAKLPTSPSASHSQDHLRLRSY